MNVVYRAKALEDVGGIYQWLERRSRSAAAKIEQAIFKAVDMLAVNSNFGRPTNENGVSRWPMTEYPYTVYYFTNQEKNVIEIVRVIDSRRVRNLKRVPKK